MALFVYFGEPLIQLGFGRLGVARADQNSPFSPNPFIAITQDDQVQLVCHRSEMGQGARTAMLMLLAEELEIDWAKVRILQADGDVRYGDQNTDGSKSVRLNWDRLREAGATARTILLQAAAEKWGVPVSECFAKEGCVLHQGSGKSIRYGELAERAAKLEVPKKVELRQPRDFKIIGKPRTHLDIDQMISGEARFGIDIKMEGMLYASVERAPTPATRLKSFNDSKTKKIPGVLKVISLEPIGKPAITNASVVVLGTNTWSALQGRRALNIEWLRPQEDSTKDLNARMEALLEKPGKAFRNQGNFAEALKGAAKRIEATYRAPYLVHAPMEPMSCTAHVTKDGCKVWAPTQDPQRARKAVADFLGVESGKVEIQVVFLGGGFGRKSQPDFILEAVAASKASGKPVKVTWTREDEIRHGFYHAQSCQQLTAALNESSELVGWRHHSVFPTIMKIFDSSVTDVAPFEIEMGATSLPYSIPNILVEGSLVNTPVRVGWYRSVCHVFHSFAINSFMDEIANAQKKDPLEYRLALLKPYQPLKWDTNQDNYKQDTGRLAKVLELAAKAIDWKKKRPPGTGVGIACHHSFFSYVAVAVEVKVEGKTLEVTHAVCAVDCGSYVNPDTVRSQMEGSIVFGMSLTLRGKVTLNSGAVEQSNFHDYPVMRMPDIPRTEVILVESSAPPAGVGEPGVPPVAPALCNAIFQATGQRIRDLPVMDQLGKSV